MMSFSDSIRTVLREKYAKIEGRAQRSEYWWFQLLNFIVALVLCGPAFFFWYQTDPYISADGIPTISWVFFGLFAIYFLAIFVPNVCVRVRRFHDVNLSGWWVLVLVLLSFVPIIDWIASIAELIITILPGTKGTNKFGTDPLAGPAADAVEVFG